MLVFILLLIIGLEAEGTLQAWHRKTCPLVKHLSVPLSRLVAEHYDLGKHYFEAKYYGRLGAYAKLGPHLRILVRKLAFRNTANDQAIAVIKYLNEDYERKYFLVLLENCRVVVEEELDKDEKDKDRKDVKGKKDKKVEKEKKGFKDKKEEKDNQEDSTETDKLIKDNKGHKDIQDKKDRKEEDKKETKDKKKEKKLFYFELNTSYPSLDNIYPSLSEAKDAAALFEKSGKWGAPESCATGVTPAPKTNIRKRLIQGIGWTLFAMASPVTIPIGAFGCVLWALGGFSTSPAEYRRLTPHWEWTKDSWRKGRYGSTHMETQAYKKDRIGVRVYEGPSMFEEISN